MLKKNITFLGYYYCYLNLCHQSVTNHMTPLFKTFQINQLLFAKYLIK